MGLEFYIVCIAAVLLTGISKGGFAGGAGAMAVPAISLFVAPQFAAAIMLPILIVIDLANVWKYRHTWVKEYVIALVPGAFVGLAIGTAVFNWVNADMMKILIGFFALYVSVAYFFRRQTVAAASQKQSGFVVLFLGALSGFMSFIAHAGGPPIKIFLINKGLDKSFFVGTNSIFFFFMNVAKVPLYFIVGQFTFESLTISLFLLPVALLGVAIGFYLHAVIKQGLFVKIVHVLLAVSGLKLLFDGAMSLLA